MASKAATAEAADTREEAAEAPLLDSVAAAIKKMVARGKERGYLTYDELNAALPTDQVSSEQIEDTMTISQRWASTSSRAKRAKSRRKPRPRRPMARSAAMSTTTISAAPTIP